MTTRRRRSDRSGRGALRSPGRPPVARREDRRRFWAAIAAGRSSEDAAADAGVSPAVGARWFRRAGGMPPSHLAPSSKPTVGALPCRSRSGRRSRSCGRRGTGCGRSPAGCGERRPRSPASCAATPPRAAAAWTYRATTAQWHADRSARRPKPAKLAVNAALRRYVQERLAGLVVAPDGAALRGPGRAVEGPPARAAAEPALGHGVEPGADRPSPAARLPRRRDDAHQPRGHLPGAVRARPRGAAPRADRLPAHRAGAARAAGAQPRAGQVLRRPRDPDQRAPGGSGRSGGAGPLGGRPHPRLGQFGDRHPGGAHDAVHDAAPPAAAWRATGADRARRTGPRSPGTAPRRCATPSRARSPPCPSSCDGR